MGILPNGEYTDIPEEWFPLTDFHIPGIQLCYEVSNYGRIYNKITKNFIPKRYDEFEYNVVSLGFRDGARRNFEVHRIIALIFVYNWDFDYSKDVNHKDGVKGHNWAWNLEWITHKENLDHCINTGLMPLGEDRKNAVFTNDQIEEICRLISEGKTDTQIENIMKLPNHNIPKTVQNIKNGHCWKHISQKYDMSKAHSRFNFTTDDIHKICKYFEDHGRDVGYKEILRFMNIDYSNMDNKKLDCLNACICGLRSKKTYKSICNLYNY